MILILFLLFAPVASVSSEDYYIDNPEEYDDLSEDPWMDPHSAYTTTTTTTTTEYKPKCQKVTVYFDFPGFPPIFREENLQKQWAFQGQ